MPNFAPSYHPARAARVYNEDMLHWLSALAATATRRACWPRAQVMRT
jgi:hypothetical protein